MAFASFGLTVCFMASIGIVKTFAILNKSGNGKYFQHLIIVAKTISLGLSPVTVPWRDWMICDLVCAVSDLENLSIR